MGVVKGGGWSFQLRTIPHSVASDVFIRHTNIRVKDTRFYERAKDSKECVTFSWWGVYPMAHA